MKALTNENWVDLFLGLLFICCVLFIMTVAQYNFSQKKFMGYYLSHGRSSYTVYINWDNAPDEIAYCTYNGQEALEVLERLQGVK